MPLEAQQVETSSPAPLLGGFGTLLVRGLLAGLVAGLLAGGVAFVLGEQYIDQAIALEEAAAQGESAAHSHGDDEALVSRDGQRAGLILATSLAGVAFGAIFATVAHYARRSTSLPGPVLALALAGAGWLAIEAVPFFKYPANPPAVGDPETISQRTWLWLAALVLGLAAVLAAAYAHRLLRGSSLTARTAAPIAVFLAIVAVGYVALPGVNEVGSDFPATLLWNFRLSALATQATLWLSLGIAFALLTERADRVRRIAA
jgi:hypothetical protein